MAETGGKRYYWLKLQDDFFKSKRIKKLRKIAGGDTYTIIYLKMQLLAMKSNGVLEYTGLEQTFAEELALDLDEEPENVSVTINFLLSCGLLETNDNVEYFVPYAVANTGSETSSTKRVREFRARKALQCNTDVTPAKQDVTPMKQNCNGEKEIEIETEIDNIYTPVVTYLNEKAGTKYRASSAKTQKVIHARAAEGFTLEDFMAVIDKKTAEWMGTEWEKFLRPETLFGPKFESYLNQSTTKKGGQQNDGMEGACAANTYQVGTWI